MGQLVCVRLKLGLNYIAQSLIKSDFYAICVPTLTKHIFAMCGNVAVLVALQIADRGRHV